MWVHIIHKYNKKKNKTEVKETKYYIHIFYDFLKLYVRDNERAGFGRVEENWSLLVWPGCFFGSLELHFQPLVAHLI